MRLKLICFLVIFAAAAVIDACNAVDHVATTIRNPFLKCGDGLRGRRSSGND
jgi:hypothetical protein